jgi:NAD(P)H dehydrogenase (quinone)
LAARAVYGSLTELMRALIVYAHPNPSSFNHALLETTLSSFKSAGYEVKLKDLYAESFQPVLGPAELADMRAGRIAPDVKREQELIAWADTLVFIYPVWWYDRPAILKGYIDRIFSYGFAFKVGANGPEGLLGSKKALIMQTTGNPREYFEKRDHIKQIEDSMKQGTIEFCGIQNPKFITFYAVGSVGDQGRKDDLAIVERTIREL